MPAPTDAEALSFQPLYKQVRDRLIKRIVDGAWAPGALLPSEMQIAAELGVHPGTVRRALDSMAKDSLVVRRQGRGTFVSTHDDERVMFQFFKIVPDAGTRTFPQSTVLSIGVHPATNDELEQLARAAGEEVVRIRRLRSISGAPAIHETITVPSADFPALETMELPNNLYGLYAMRFNVTIASSKERLKAVAADAMDGEALGIAVGHPLLQINRVAYAVDKTPVELRRSNCLTEQLHYRSELF